MKGTKMVSEQGISHAPTKINFETAKLMKLKHFEILA